MCPPIMSVQPSEMQQKCNYVTCCPEESGIWIFLSLDEYLHLRGSITAIRESSRANRWLLIAAAIY